MCPPSIPRCPSTTCCRRVITEAGLSGTFNSTAQFPLDGSAAGVAAAGAASLAHPEVAALALPQGPVAEPALAAAAPSDAGVAPESSKASPPTAEASLAGGMGAAQDAEAAAFVAAQESQEAPLTAQPGSASGSSPAGEECTSTLDLLDAHSSYSIFRSLIATAGKLAC